MQDQPLACFQVRFWSCDVQMILSRPGAALRGLDGCSVYILPLGSSCAVRLVFPRTSWLLFGFCDSLTALWLELRLLARPNCPFREPLRDVCREKTCRSDAACGCPRQGGLPSSQDRSHAWTRVQRHERPRCRLVCNVCSGSSYSHQIQQKNEEEERGHLHGVLVQLLHQMPLEKRLAWFRHVQERYLADSYDGRLGAWQVGLQVWRATEWLGLHCEGSGQTRAATRFHHSESGGIRLSALASGDGSAG